MTKIPRSLINYYDTILQDFSVGGASQDLSKLSKVLHPEYNMCPDRMQPTAISKLPIERHVSFGPYGPGIRRLRFFYSLVAAIVPDLKYERQLTLLFDDRIVVMCKLSGTITNITGTVLGF